MEVPESSFENETEESRPSFCQRKSTSTSFDLPALGGEAVNGSNAISWIVERDTVLRDERHDILVSWRRGRAAAAVRVLLQRHEMPDEGEHQADTIDEVEAVAFRDLLSSPFFCSHPTKFA